MKLLLNFPLFSARSLLTSFPPAVSCLDNPLCCAVGEVAVQPWRKQKKNILPYKAAPYGLVCVIQSKETNSPIFYLNYMNIQVRKFSRQEVFICRSMDLWKTCISSLYSTDNCRFQLFRSSSSQHLLQFLKSSSSCVLLLRAPITSVICPSMASSKRQFLLRI